MLRFASLMLAVAPGAAQTTQILPLSGMGEAGEKPVYWDFQLDHGRGSGEWTTIAVPSWEQQGFGAYYYGTQGRGKPDDDPVIPKETGTTGATFERARGWGGRDIHIVFEAAMTDTTVLDQRPVRRRHASGRFLSFQLRHHALVQTRPQRDRGRRRQGVVQQERESRRAARRLLDVRRHLPARCGSRRGRRDHIVWTAIDARADGSFYARAHLNRRHRAGARRSRADLRAGGQGARRAHRVSAHPRRHARSSPASSQARLWTAETPHLYRSNFSLRRAAAMHGSSNASASALRSAAARRRLSQRPQDRAEGHQPPQLRSEDRPHAHARSRTTPTCA